MSTVSIFVGIDVSQASLDLALRPHGERWPVPNADPGIARILARLTPLSPPRIVVEATEGLEIPLTGVLAAAGLSRWSSSPLARCETSRKPWGNSPSRMPSMRPSSPTLPKRCVLSLGYCRMPRRRPSGRC